MANSLGFFSSPPPPTFCLLQSPINSVKPTHFFPIGDKKLAQKKEVFQTSKSKSFEIQATNGTQATKSSSIVCQNCEGNGGGVNLTDHFNGQFKAGPASVGFAVGLDDNKKGPAQQNLASNGARLVPPTKTQSHRRRWKVGPHRVPSAKLTPLVDSSGAVNLATRCSENRSYKPSSAACHSLLRSSHCRTGRQI
ncbi:hypothetical protein F2Q70_00011256 [Brassica cretica]|nr:hypothetical protein F2Q70_00011256 [Brassica cretica]KAF3549771.1 hypothetical protein DY000_02006408 [Brassica cretica]